MPVLQRSALRLGVALALLVPCISPIWAQESSNPVLEAGKKAIARREMAVESSRKLLLQGDRLMADQDFAGAFDAYRAAFGQIPDTSATRELRLESVTKYEAALQAQARAVAEEGRLEDAIALVQQFYQEVRDSGLPPATVSPATKRLLADLQDGETFEPANSPEMVERKREVKRLFAYADGAVQTGQYDEATRHYAQILNLDPTNQAARRGMERVDKLVSEYHKAARDQTRATALAKVTAQWENPVPRFSLDGASVETAPAGPTSVGSVREKLRQIVIPEVEFAQTPLQEAVEYLSARSKELDAGAAGGRKGVDIVLGGSDPADASIPVTLRLAGAPLGTILDYVAKVARLKVRVDEVAVTLVPLSAPDQTAIVTKSYRVPPNFISAGATGAGGAAGDPFGASGAAPASGTLQKKLTAIEFLKMNGVAFGPEAGAEFIPSTSTLLVRNTQDQLELIEAMIESSFGSVAKLLRFDVKTIEISESKLEEMGFDWLLGQFNLPGSDRVFGAGGTQGNQAAGSAQNEYPFIPPGGNLPLGRNPVTAGNRSGDSAAFQDAIATAINRDVSFGSQGTGIVKAPGIFSVGGVFTDPQFQVVMRGIKQSAARDLMTNNSVVGRAGQQAILKSVREFVYPTEYDPPEIPDQVGNLNNNNLNNNNNIQAPTSSFAPITPAHPTAFETRELGSLVQVEGTIGADNYTIDLTMTPEVSRFEGFVNYGSPIRQYNTNAIGQQYVEQEVQNRILMPVFKVLRNSVNVSVYSGQTVVVGGLMEAKIQADNDKTPILGDAPLVGHLFRSKVEQREMRAVIFFVTVNIIDPSGGTVQPPVATTASL
jgi:general secretion pathway protein D